MKYYEVGDEIIGDKILCESRQISNVSLINKSGKHKAQRIVLKDNAKCRIMKKARFIGKME